MLQQYFIALFISGLSHTLLATFVYLNSKSKSSNITYVGYSYSIAFWSCGQAFAIIQHQYQAGLYLWRISHIGVIFIPVFFVHFVMSLFPSERQTKQQFVLFLSYCFGIFFFILNFLGYLISDVSPKGHFRFAMEPGPLYLMFVLVWVIWVSYGLLKLFKLYQISNESRRKQLQYFSVSMFFAYVGGAPNFLPAFRIEVPILMPYGTYAIAIYAFFTAFAIVEHRLFDIEVIIKKTLVFAGLTSFVFGVFAGITFLAREILSTYVQVPSAVANILSIAIVVLCYDPLRNFLVNVTDRFLSQKKFNYAKVLRETSKDIALVTSLTELTRRIIAVLIRKARTKNTAIFIRNVKDDHLELKGCYGYGRKNRPDIVLQSESTIVKFLDEHQQPFTRQQLEEEKTRVTDPERRDRISIILQLMNILKAQVVVPSFLGGAAEITGNQKSGTSLRSLLILGEKKSDEDYYEEDLDMLATLAQEHAIAFENARLFDEALERSKELQQMNTELVKVQADLLNSLNETELASRKLHEAQAALIVAEKNATMVGMAKAIGHEVNNPLSTVAGRAMFIQKTRLPKVKDIIERYKGKITAEEYELARTSFEKIDDDSTRIATCAKRIEIVVKTLTGIMKESTGELQPLSFLVLWKEAAEAVRFNTYEENLSSCQIIEGIAANLIVQGNLEQLIQVFLNLIKNSYEAMMNQAEKCITVKADVDPDDPRYALIVVSDNGPGIPPDILPKIWGQGFSTKKKTSSDIGAVGQGQGLYIVKHMVESVHKGTIIAESMPGHGTSFIIRLPIAEEHVVMRTNDQSNKTEVADSG